jgi:ribosomal protein S27AE
MARLVRKCEQCGKVDSRDSWASADEASKKNAFDDKWSCSSCAWTEFELVDADAETAEKGKPVNAG